MSRMLKNIGLFCKRALQKRPVFCKETYIFKHPAHRSHPISNIEHVMTLLTLLIFLMSNIKYPPDSDAILVAIGHNQHSHI